MPGKRGREEVDADLDDFIEDDDGNAPKSKKSKKAQGSKSSSKSADKSWEVSLFSFVCKTITNHTSSLLAEPRNALEFPSSKARIS